MDLLNMATKLFMSNTNSSNLDSNTVMAGLKGLLTDQSGNIDLAGLVSKFSSSGLSSIATSWLGDGDNETLSTQQITETLGQDKLSNFASGLGIDTNSAASGLASMIPQLIDKSSGGGSLLSGDTLNTALGNMGGLGGLFK